MMNTIRVSARRALSCALVCALAAAACDDSPTHVDPDDETASLLVRADFASSAVTLLVIEVRAADLDSPLAFQIPVDEDATVDTVIEVPAGSDRTIIAHAFDVGGIETHRGEATIDVRAGENATVSITLLPLNGDVPIIIDIGTIVVTVTPPTATLAVGDTLRLVATVVDAVGDTLHDAVPSWASLDPDVATVSGNGLVTAASEGTATIIATFGGVAASAGITVNMPGATPALELVSDALVRPVDLRSPAGDFERLFVVQKRGDIVIIENGALLDSPFLDLVAGIDDTGERGLLSLAFHPSYATNGFFYVMYTRAADGAVRIERYTVSDDPDVADAGSALPIITVPHDQATNHNGGQLHFGPDGYLYASIGDGGAGQAANAQDTTALLGKIIRLDVDGGSPYAVPPDNPFVGVPGRDEIWAYGLRNPWRASFDPLTGDYYIADVGQNRREEVNVQPAGAEGGANYGWSRMEASLCHPADPCDTDGLVLPVVEYEHDPECSITGGYVYRGTALTALQGHYLYADYCSGRVWSFRYQAGAAIDMTEWTATLSPGAQITSFGRDAHGELYVLRNAGTVHRIVAE